MYFNNISSLVAMDGHGVYVWSAYGVAFLIILYNLLAPLVARQKLVARLQRQKQIKMQQQRVRRSTVLRAKKPALPRTVVEEREY